MDPASIKISSRIARLTMPCVLACFGIVSTHSSTSDAAAAMRGVGAQCAIDNDDSVEANMYISAGVYFNGDASNSGKVQCNLNSGLYSVYPDMHEVDEVEIYVADYNNDSTTGVVSATLGSKSLSSVSVWTTCGTESTSDIGWGGFSTLSWTGLDVNASCLDYTDRGLFASVTIPDSDAGGDSGMVGYYVWQP